MLKTLLKHSSIYLFGLGLNKGLTVLVFILFARSLLPTVFGEYVLFITLIQIVSNIADFGLIQWYQKHHAEDLHLFTQIFVARLFTLTMSAGLLFIFALFTHSFSATLSLLLIITLIPEALLSLSDSYYLAQRKAYIVSLKGTSRQLILLCGFLLLYQHFTLTTAIYLNVLGAFLTLAWSFPWQQLSGKLEFNQIFTVLKKSSHYALLIVTSFAYSRGDSLIINYTLSSTALGLYGAAYRFLESLSLVPTALAHNLFPISAQKAGITKAQTLKITGGMAVLGTGAAAVLYFGADFLIGLLLGSTYIAALPLLQIFSMVLWLFFVNSPLTTIVQSSHILPKFLVWGIANTVLNLLLNIIFVPIYGVTAAAWVMLLTEVSGLIINLAFIRLLYLPHHHD